jgi:hypothetical protein
MTDPVFLHHLQQTLPHLRLAIFSHCLVGAAAGVPAAVPEPGRGGEAALPEPAPTWTQPSSFTTFRWHFHTF